MSRFTATSAGKVPSGATAVTAPNIDRSEWDRFVADHDRGGLYHSTAWCAAIRSAYRHVPEFLAASPSAAGITVRALDPEALHGEATPSRTDAVIGLFPIVHLRHWLFGNTLTSMPFCDSGGVLTDDRSAERLLLEHAMSLAQARGAEAVDVRQTYPLACLEDRDFAAAPDAMGSQSLHSAPDWAVANLAADSKVRMLLDLPEDPDRLMRAFDAKLRSQIRKSEKNGLTAATGGAELIDDFYRVFCVNMRDLGSPVHAKAFVSAVLANFSQTARVHIVYGQGVPMAGGLTVGFNGISSNPWASSLRRYGHLAPNMLLYWTMLDHACRAGYRAFDFGRSSMNEGTYRFKKQWGARAYPLYWYRFARRGRPRSASMSQDKERMGLAVKIWKRLPVAVTRFLGPKIRRHISL